MHPDRRKFLRQCIQGGIYNIDKLVITSCLSGREGWLNK